MAIRNDILKPLERFLFPPISSWCTLGLTAVLPRLLSMVEIRLGMAVEVLSKLAGLKIS